MASVNEPCCGHDHVGGDELWLTLDEVRDIVRETVRGMVGDDGRLKDAGQLRAEDERAYRERVDGQIAEVQQRRAAKPAQTWRERLWG